MWCPVSLWYFRVRPARQCKAWSAGNIKHIGKGHNAAGALPDVAAGHVNVHGHRHALRSSGPRIDVSVEQLDYRSIRLDRLRRLAAVLVTGEEPPGATTLEQVRHVEGAA